MQYIYIYISIYKFIYIYIYIYIYIPGRRPLTSNCGAPTKNCLEFLDCHLKPLLQRGWSYIKDSGGFIRKTRNLGSIHENSILVTANVVGLYPSIPNEAGLSALKEVRNNREQHAIPASKLMRMADFVLKNNYFEFNGQVKQNIFGTKFIVWYLLLVPSLPNPARIFYG